MKIICAQGAKNINAANNSAMVSILTDKTGLTGKAVILTDKTDPTGKTRMGKEDLPTDKILTDKTDLTDKTRMGKAVILMDKTDLTDKTRTVKGDRLTGKTPTDKMSKARGKRRLPKIRLRNLAETKAPQIAEAEKRRLRIPAKNERERTICSTKNNEIIN